MKTRPLHDNQLAFASSTATTEPEREKLTSPSSTLPPPLYSIPWLKRQVFSDIALTVERTVSRTRDLRIEIVSYPVEELKLNALMLTPCSAKPTDGFPVVIVNHGYVTPKAYSTINDYRRICDHYACNGFLVLKPDYRGHGDSGGNHGSYFSRMGYSLDVLSLVHAAQHLSDINPGRIYMHGHSLGGDITLRVLEITDKVKAASIWSPVSEDFPEGYLHFLRRKKPEMATKVKAELESAMAKNLYPLYSPRNYLDQISTPLIIHHGTDDESVPYSSSTNLAAKLEATDANYILHTYLGEDHNFQRGSWSTLAARDVALFETY